MRFPLAALCLLLLALAAFWPRLTTEQWLGTEARRVQIALEMHASGNWLVPTLGQEPTFAKPPLYYWVLDAIVPLLGTTPFALRLPALLGFLLLVWATFWHFHDVGETKTAWLASLGILCAPAVLHDGTTAEIDPLFAALTALSLLLIARGIAFSGPRALCAGGIAGGLALLVKGPPYLLFFAGLLLVWWRHRRLAGLWRVLVPLVAVPLCYYVPLLAKVDAAIVFDVAATESVGRVAHWEFEHLLDVPLYLARAALIALPFGFFAPYEHWGARSAWLQRGDLCMRLCLAGAVSGVCLLVFFPGRPNRYLLPAVPLLVIAMAPRVAAFARAGTPLLGWPQHLVRGIAVLAGGLLVVTPFVRHPAAGALVPLWLFLGLGALLVRTRVTFVAAILLAPVAGVWALAGAPLAATPRIHQLAAPVILREVQARGATDLATRGHFPAQVLVPAGLLVPGDERMQRQPAGRWLLVEDPDRRVEFDAARHPAYVDRVRLRIPGKSLVLQERRQ